MFWHRSFISQQLALISWYGLRSTSIAIFLWSDALTRRCLPHLPPTPPDIICWIEQPSLLVSQALMQSRDISLILATGGPQMVRCCFCRVDFVYGEALVAAATLGT